MDRRAVVILAAGQGTRMRSPLPKILHTVGARTLLDRAIDAAQETLADRVVVVCSSRDSEVATHVERRLGAAAVAVQAEPRGTAHAVLAAREALADHDGDVAVITADAPLLEGSVLCTLFDARSRADLVVMGFEASVPGAYGRLIHAAGGSLEKIVEARDADPDQLAVRICNSGVIAAPAALLFELLADVRAENVKGEYYLTDVVGLASLRGRRVDVVMAPETVLLGVNSQMELAEAERVFQTGRRRAALEAGVAMPLPDTIVFAYDTQLEPGCRIEPYVVFGPAAIVRSGATVRSFSHVEGAIVEPHAQIGPFTRLRPGAQVGERAHVGNFVEIKNVALGAAAKVNHLAYLGDGDVGARVNVGAGVIFCNYDGFAKHRTTIGDDAFIGSNAALVAPVRVGRGAYVGSGSVVTRDVAADALAVARPEQVEKTGWARAFRARERSAR